MQSIHLTCTRLYEIHIFIYNKSKWLFLTDHFSKFAVLFKESLVIFFCSVYVDGSTTMQGNITSNFSLHFAELGLDNIFLICSVPPNAWHVLSATTAVRKRNFTKKYFKQIFNRQNIWIKHYCHSFGIIMDTFVRRPWCFSTNIYANRIKHTRYGPEHLFRAPESAKGKGHSVWCS